MRLSIAGSLAICLASAHAFKNTSPLFIFSTADHIPQDAKQLVTSDDALKTAFEFLSTCPSKHYLLVAQENVNVEDYTSERAVPFLKQAMRNERVKSVLNIAEVVDQSTTDAIQGYLQKECGVGRLEVFEGMDSSAYDTYFTKGPDSPKITRLNYQGLPSGEPSRSRLLADFDSSLNSLLRTLPRDSEWTVIYTTTPVSAHTETSSYNPKFQEPLKMELKRQLDGAAHIVESKNETDPRPLFEKYQFLSPGIFMALITILILVAILSVGISAIAGLQVSYGAFDKEMGPAASKK